MFEVLMFSRKAFKEFFNSVLLSLYMLLALYFYFAEGGLKVIVTLSILIVSVLSLFYSRIDKTMLKLNYNNLFLWIVIFLICVTIEILNGTLNSTVLYLLAAPAFAYFFVNSKFNIKILYLPLIISTLIFTYFILLGADLNSIFEDTSRNYISVVMITNVVMIGIVEWRQGGRIAIWTGAVAMFFSFFAIGRSGIICSLLLFLVLLYFSYNKLSKKAKIFYCTFLILPVIFVFIIQVDSILMIVKGLSVMERFNELGMKASYRDLLLNSYLENIDFTNFLMGYNYQSNYLFMEKNNNPHNSFVQLHYNSGFLFFFVILAFIRASFSFLVKNQLYLAFMAILLLRGWTDSIFFFGAYDFLLISLILFSKKVSYVG